MRTSNEPSKTFRCPLSLLCVLVDSSRNPAWTLMATWILLQWHPLDDIHGVAMVKG